MKIGITIPGYFDQYLEKIANLNGSNKTKVCSLIVENFLSYNLKQKKFPLFRKDVRIVFANDKAVSERSCDSDSNSDRSCSSDQDSEQSSVSWSEITDQLESYDVDDEVVDSDCLPF